MSSPVRKTVSSRRSFVSFPPGGRNIVGSRTGGAYGMTIDRTGSSSKIWLTVSGQLCGQKGDPTHAEAISCDRPLRWDANAQKLDFAPLSEARFPDSTPPPELRAEAPVDSRIYTVFSPTNGPACKDYSKREFGSWVCPGDLLLAIEQAIQQSLPDEVRSIVRQASIPNLKTRGRGSSNPNPGNARTHSPKQIKQISRSIERFGFNNPVLVDDDDQIIAGHGRVEAAKLLNLKTVPTVRLSHLSETEKKAYIIADNRLAEKAGWDNEVLAIELQGLVDLGFDVLLTGFEPAETDIIFEGIGDESEQPENQVPEEPSGPPVSRLGDVWLLGKHVLVCGDSTDAATYKHLMRDDKAELVFTDPPYNVKIGGNVSGLGRVKHREFAMASGEMSEGQFTTFLSRVYALCCQYSVDGSIHQICMDWRHMREMLSAGDRTSGSYGRDVR
jgi:hypothetical protein